jgi:hypothetical protein
MRDERELGKDEEVSIGGLRLYRDGILGNSKLFLHRSVDNLAHKLADVVLLLCLALAHCCCSSHFLAYFSVGEDEVLDKSEVQAEQTTSKCARIFFF